MFRWNILCFILCPLALILSPGINGKSLAHFLQYIFRHLYRMKKSSWACPSLGRSLSSLNFSSLTIFMTLCSGVPGTGPVAAGVTSPVLRQKKDHLLQPVGSTSNTASQYNCCRLLGQGHITGSRSVSMLFLSICLKSLTLNCRWIYKAINKLILTQCPRWINIRIVIKWPLEGTF